MHRLKSDLVVQISNVQEFHDHWINCKLLIEEADNAVLSTAKIELIFYHVGEIILLVVGEHSSNVHRNDQLGDSARDSLLIIFALSKKDDNVGQYLAYESDICPVLATGLSGLYSSLPKKLVPRYGLRYNNDDISVKSPGGRVSVTTPIYIQSDLLNPCLLELQVGGAEWHQLTENECSNSIDLRRFLRTLHFCNLTVKILSL
ncbi:UPF0518 protein [Schistosoma japonicum]|uniref:UPF0518 protein n=1 Tax=Schistosoma japonicum TaxID=6182 RepID=A0A4Z2CLS1_SCHJA|nr:UPF0518 protein [Schistosoma japonicum]